MSLAYFLFWLQEVD